MSGIVWEDPPDSYPRGGAAPRYADFFESIRKMPGRWAVWPNPVQSPTLTTNIKNGKYSGTEAGEFDATIRKQDDGTYKMWVRYVGGES